MGNMSSNPIDTLARRQARKALSRHASLVIRVETLEIYLQTLVAALGRSEDE